MRKDPPKRKNTQNGEAAQKPTNNQDKPAAAKPGPNPNKPPVAPNTPPAATIPDLSNYKPLAESLVAYYGGAANQAYRVQKQKGADGKMEIVITPVDQNANRRTLRIQYQGQPDANGLMQGTLVVDDKMSVPVTLDTKRGTNLIDPEDSKKLMEYINPTTTSNKPNEPKKNENKDRASNEQPTFELFDPFARPAAAPTQPTTPAEALTKNPSFWDRLGESFASSLPFLIAMLLMRSNDSSEE